MEDGNGVVMHLVGGSLGRKVEIRTVQMRCIVSNLGRRKREGDPPLRSQTATDRLSDGTRLRQIPDELLASEISFPTKARTYIFSLTSGRKVNRMKMILFLERREVKSFDWCLKTV